MDDSRDKVENLPEKSFDIPEVKPAPIKDEVVMVGGRLFWKNSGILITRRDLRRFKYGKKKSSK